MITVTLAKNTHEVAHHTKADVVVSWISTGGRPIDAFTRDTINAFPEQFRNSFHNVPNTSRKENGLRFQDGAAGVFRDNQRVYVSAVVARNNPTCSVISARGVEDVLTNIANAMRVDGLKTLMIPNISTARSSGLRTSALLDIIDRVMPDINVYLATVVELETHGRAALDIRNSYVPKPKIEIKRKPAEVINSGWITPYSRQPAFY